MADGGSYGVSSHAAVGLDQAFASPTLHVSSSLPACDGGHKILLYFFKSEPMQQVCGTSTNARDALLKVYD
jgi:hypothetical protein